MYADEATEGLTPQSKESQADMLRMQEGWRGWAVGRTGVREKGLPI